MKRNVHKTVSSCQGESETHSQVVAGFFCVQFYCPWLLLVSGWILQLWERLQWAWECPVHSAIISSTYLPDFVSYRKTAVSTQWCHLYYLGLSIWDYVNSIVTSVVITQRLVDHQQGFDDNITILRV